MTEEGSKGGLWRRVRDTGAKAIERYHRLGWKGKLVFGLGSDCIFLAGVVVLIIGPNEIFARFASLADEIRSLSYAWAIFLAVTVVLSFPPMIGFGTAQTLAGFASTLWPGFLVSAGSCLLGSTLTFLQQHLSQADSRLVRLALSGSPGALAGSSRKGFLLIVLLRLCPLPFSYSNASFASIETASLPLFMLGTCYLFIGDRVYKFADPESRGEMDTLSKGLNAPSIVVSAALAVGASYYVYNTTKSHAALPRDEEAAEQASSGKSAPGSGRAPAVENSASERGSSETDGSSPVGSGDKAAAAKAQFTRRKGRKTSLRRSTDKYASSGEDDGSDDGERSLDDCNVQYERRYVSRRMS